MTTISVVIPKGGTTSQPVEPTLVPHIQAIARNRLIAWHFSSEDPNVKRVRITFTDKKKPPFFPNKLSDKHWFEQDVIYRKSSHGPDPSRYDGQTLIWGAAPDYNVHKKDKYVIEGKDANGKVVALLDPYILTTKPS